MAEVNTNPVEQSTDTTTQQSAENTSNGGAEVDTQHNETITIQEMQDKVQELLTENAKLKRAVSKSNSEANGWKDKYNATLSATERASQEKAEAEAQRAEELESLKRYRAVNELSKEYMKRGYSAELAEKIAEAEYSGDTDSRFKIMDQFAASQKKSWEQEWIKTRPQINAGSGDGATVTQEQFNAMNLHDRTKLLRENPALYNRLTGRK